MSTRMLSPRPLPFLIVLLMAAGTAMAAGGTFSAHAGFVSVKDDVGDFVTSEGINLAAEGHLFASDNISIGGGLGVAPMKNEFEGLLDSIGMVTLHASLRFYSTKTTPGPRIFLGGVFGIGALAWEYETVNMAGDDSDGVAFTFFGPEGGVEFWMSDQFFIQGKARYMLTSYADETSEDMNWIYEDGNMLVVEAGLGVGF